MKKINRIVSSNINSCIINSKTYKGSNISINDKIIIIDGKEIPNDSKDIFIKINGNVKIIEIEEGNIDVSGNVESIKTMSGDVDVKGDIHGNVKTMSGDVEANGSIDGNVSTMSGDITEGEKKVNDK